MALHGDKHGGYAVDTGAAFALDAAQHGRRIKSRAGYDHCRAVGGAAQIGHHHAKAVIEGHRDAQPIVFREREQFGGEVPVVEDVAVRQSRALGKAGRALRVLNVDCIGWVERAHPLG